MNEKTLKITQGALTTAVMGVLIFLNRQTGGIAEGILTYIYPLPVAIYAAKYGLRTSLPAAAAMTLISFLLGTPTGAIYVLCEILVGLALGTCLYHKVDMTKTLLLIMILSGVANMLNLVILSGLSGVNLSEEAAVLQESFLDAGKKFGVEMPAQMMDTGFLQKIMIIGVAASGFLQGFLIYEIGLLIMRKLRVKVQKPMSIYELHPPRWTGYAAFAIYLVCSNLPGLINVSGRVETILLSFGIFADVYLLFFGFIAANLFLRSWLKGHRFLCAFLSLILCFVIGGVIVLLGFLYLSGLAALLSDVYRPKKQEDRSSDQKRDQ